MYDTAMRVKLVKIRIRKKQRQHEKFNFYKLAVLCVILSSSLVYMVYDAIGINKAVTYGMYGSILLHEDAGGYIMVAIISFIAAVIITFICIKYKEKEDRIGQLKLLYSYRKKLLDIVHSDRDKLNCLDYLIYLLQKYMLHF